jgi:hypothetical protein
MSRGRSSSRYDCTLPRLHIFGLTALALLAVGYHWGAGL